MHSRKNRRVEKLRRFEAICADLGLPLTVQRRSILEAVADRTDHPSAEVIFDALRGEHPEISRATVYRTLDLFAEVGVIRKVCHPGSSVRYDPNTDRHHHLVCMECSRMVDFEDPDLDRIPLPGTGRQGFRISDYTIQFRGICGECRKGRPEGPPARRGKRK
jgi:Fur family transcriptional regulator, peroxide stress response regulator